MPNSKASAPSGARGVGPLEAVRCFHDRTLGARVDLLMGAGARIGLTRMLNSEAKWTFTFPETDGPFAVDQWEYVSSTSGGAGLRDVVNRRLNSLTVLDQ